jgi:hypothetical protein
MTCRKKRAASFDAARFVSGRGMDRGPRRRSSPDDLARHRRIRHRHVPPGLGAFIEMLKETR